MNLSSAAFAATGVAPAASIKSFVDAATFAATHVVSCPVTGEDAVIDSVLDFDPNSGRTNTAAADRVLAHVSDAGLKVRWHPENHAHADRLSTTPYLKDQLGGRIGIGRRIRCVQKGFKTIFNAKDMATDGSTSWPCVPRATRRWRCRS
jgi:hypothetical protein